PQAGGGVLGAKAVVNEPQGVGGDAAAGVPRRGWRRRAGTAVAVCGWLCLAGALGAWALLRAADLWWPATLLMFSPRWLLAVPPALLLPLALVLRRRALVPLLLALALVAGPVMGLCVPWPLPR